MSDAQTMRYARNWAKLQMKKAARPKRTVTAETLANLARGRQIRAANLAKMKGGFIPQDVKDYAKQAKRFLRSKTYDASNVVSGLPIGAGPRNALGILNARLANANQASFARENPMDATQFPIPPAFYGPPVLPPGYGKAALGAAALGAAGYGLYRLGKKSIATSRKVEREMAEEEAYYKAVMAAERAKYLASVKRRIEKERPDKLKNFDYYYE